MSVFRHSRPPVSPISANTADRVSVPPVMDSSDATLFDRPIGEIMRQANSLTAEQILKVATYQQQTGMRFGEAAVALGLARSEDVLWALSQQFHYPYSQSRHAPSDELVVALQPFSEQAEAFRAMRSQLMMRLYNNEGQQRQAIAVLSPESGDGKTYFAANMAVAFSQLSGRTLLVDADMRNPRQHQVFGVDPGGVGLSTILSNRAEPNVIQPVPDLPNLFILPVGTIPPNPLELVERPAFGLLMRELLSKFDYVLVDTPAAAYGTDGAVIASKCGAALVIARQDKSQLAAMQKMLQTVSVGAPKIVGAVFNEF